VPVFVVLRRRGGYGSGFRTGDFIERWNGSSWRPVSRATGSPRALSSVSCLSRSFCLAVGALSTDTLGERWNGRSWSRVKTVSPSGPGYDGLSSVDCVTQSDCWAVGNAWMNGSGGTAVEHFNGHSWQIRKLPIGPAQYAPIAVSCRALGACWIVTSKKTHNPVALRLEAGAWQVVSMPHDGPSVGRGLHDTGGQTLNAVDCAAASQCWAVGSAPGSGPSSQPLFAEEWNGSGWHIAKVNSPSGYDAFDGVSCGSISRCVAVGSVGGSKNSSPLVAFSKPLS
jgi:hypothetical protein